jgi:hypothetical protein
VKKVARMLFPLKAHKENINQGKMKFLLNQPTINFSHPQQNADETFVPRLLPLAAFFSIYFQTFG